MSASLLTSARMARLPAPSNSLAACNDPSFKPQMATRAPSLSNSCAAASPIPLLPPVMRIFLSASRPIVVTPFSSQHCPVIADPLVEAARSFMRSAWPCLPMPWAVRGLHLCEAAVHRQFRSRDVAAVVGCEKDHGLGDFIGRAEPAERRGD